MCQPRTARILSEPGGIEIEANSVNRLSQQDGSGPQHVKRIVPSSQLDELAAIRTFHFHIDSIHHHIRVQQMVRLAERFSPRRVVRPVFYCAEVSGTNFYVFSSLLS